MLKYSVRNLQFSEVIGLRVVVIFVCVKNAIASTELCVDDDFEMITFVVKGMVAKYTWEVIGNYRALNDDMLAIEISAVRTLTTRNLTKRIIRGGGLN
jgi:carbamoylphosphate synthase small subunit